MIHVKLHHVCYVNDVTFAKNVAVNDVTYCYGYVICTIFNLWAGFETRMSNAKVLRVS